MLQNRLPLCSRFVSNSPGNLKDFENSAPPFIVQSNVIYESTSSMVFISSCCFFKNKSLNMLRLKKKETDLDRKGRVIPISSLNTRFLIVKEQFLISNIIALIRIFSINYLLPRLLKAQDMEVADYPLLLQTFGLKTKCIISEKTSINHGVYIVVCKVVKP